MAEEPVEGEPGGGEEEKKIEYCKEISEEQLTAFYEKAGDNEAAVKFAQEEHMSPPHTLIMYQLGMETLENIKSGFSMKKTEKKFKNLIFRWSVKVKNTNYVTQLTTIELQKIVPFFMTTVFQHYKLFANCFNQEPLQWKYYEEVFIEVPENILYPLKDFDTMEEFDGNKQAWAEYEKIWAECEAERLAAEEKAQWILENPLFPPDPRRSPENLDEYIDFSVRDKVEEVFNLMQEQYGERKAILYGRVQALKENDPNSPYWRRLKSLGMNPHEL